MKMQLNNNKYKNNAVYDDCNDCNDCDNSDYSNEYDTSDSFIDDDDGVDNSDEDNDGSIISEDLSDEENKSNDELSGEENKSGDELSDEEDKSDIEIKKYKSRSRNKSEHIYNQIKRIKYEDSPNSNMQDNSVTVLDDGPNNNNGEGSSSTPITPKVDKNMALYDNICKDLSNIPNPTILLSLPISYEEKKELIEKLILLHTVSPISMEFFDIKRSIDYYVNKYKNCTVTSIEQEKYDTIKNSLTYMETEKSLEHKILDMDINLNDKAFIYEKYKLLQIYESTGTQSGGKLQQWINYIVNIPTTIKPVIENYNSSDYARYEYLFNVKKTLDIEVYGLNDVKERILFLLNNMLTNKNIKGLNFALSGPPGVAKTSIIQVLSKAIKLPFFQINSAGMENSSYLLGHNFTYEGSGPGCIVEALINMKYKNGIIYFDEFDKISTTTHGLEISRTLLHITDATQNYKFHDHYIGEQFNIDLSNIWFIYSLNDKEMIEPTLRDRISIIEVPGYSNKEKKIIAIQYMLPKLIKNINLPADSVSFDIEALEYLIDISNKISVEKDGKSGVRQLKNYMEEILMKVNFLNTFYSIPSDQRDNSEIGLSFNIPEFKLPITINKKNIIDLNINNGNNNVSATHMSMYF
jgi:ATP-dependent Lon protease